MFCGKQLVRATNQVREPATTRNRAPQQNRTSGAVRNAFGSVFVLFRVVRTLSESCLWCLGGCCGPKLFWKRKKTTKNRSARFPLYKGQVLDRWFRVLTWQRPLSNPDEFSAVVEPQAKQELSAKRPETKVKCLGWSFSLGKRWFGTQFVFCGRVEDSGESEERLLGRPPFGDVFC